MTYRNEVETCVEYDTRVKKESPIFYGGGKVVAGGGLIEPTVEPWNQGKLKKNNLTYGLCSEQ